MTARAGDAAWSWQDAGDGGSGAERFQARQDYSGAVTATGQSTALAAPDSGDTGISAAIFATANFLSFRSGGGSTVITVQQLRGADPSLPPADGGEPATRATLSGDLSSTDGSGSDGAIDLDVQAIHNFLGLDLSSDDAAYPLSLSVDQQSSGDVSATAGGIAWSQGTEAGQTSYLDAGAAAAMADGQTGGLRTTAIGNYTSLRYDSNAEGDAR